MRFIKRIVDVGPEGVQGHAPLVVALGPSDLGPAQAPGALDLDALCPGPDGGLNGPLHGPAERDALADLVGDVLRHQPGVDLGTLDLLDVHGDLGNR